MGRPTALGERWLRELMLTASAFILLPPGSGAAVSDLSFADVTPRAFAVVWAVDEPVVSATVRVFSEASGSTELTGGLTSTTATTGFALGLVRVTVAGLGADTCVYVQAETTTATGTEFHPVAPPYLEVCTEVETARANAEGAPIANDLILHDLLLPDGETSATGVLLLLSVPGLASYPLSAFAGEGFALPAAVADLNNLYDASTRTSAEVTGGEVLQLVELRGLTCPGLDDHRLLRFRRAPAHEEGTRISELEEPEPCFFADTVCDGVVNILDAQRVLNVFGATLGECAFNPDLDIVEDGVINVLDVQSVLNRFGESAPFGP